MALHIVIVCKPKKHDTFDFGHSFSKQLLFYYIAGIAFSEFIALQKATIIYKSTK